MRYDRPSSSDPLVDAAWAGRADLVADLLSQGAGPNRKDERGISPLRAAMYPGGAELIRALLAAGADPNEVTNPETGSTLLSLAALFSRVEAMRLLLEAGADPNPARPRDDDATVLMQAAASQANLPDEFLARRVEMVRMLIAAGADVNATGYRGHTALGCTLGEDELVRMLLEAGATIRPWRPGEELLLLNVLGNRTPRPSRERGILRLIAAGAEIHVADDNGETPLKRACALGSRRVVAALLEAGARRVGAVPSRRVSSSPELHLAAAAGEPQVVRMLLHQGADPTELDEAGRTPIYRAARNGRAEAIRILLEAGVDPNDGRERGRSPLRVAAYHGHEECVALLLEAGADVDAQTDGEVTALHLAALMRRRQVIPWLLRAGANVDARDDEGCTPLMWALRTYAVRPRALIKVAGTVDLLLAAGADPLAVDWRGRTALFEAVRYGLADEARRLLALGLDANAAAHDGRTPLMAAAAESVPHLPSIEALLAAGADANAVDRDGGSALHHLIRPMEPPDPLPLYWSPFRPWVSVKIVEVLLRAGADVNRADERGVTPLMLAARNTSYDLISPLLRSGADPEARDRAGRSARDHAEAAGRAWP